MPFRKAHAVVGQLVAEAHAKGVPLPDVAAASLATTSPAVAARLGEIFNPDFAVRSKVAMGGTAPESVRAALRAARARVAGMLSTTSPSA
jgi:argininosuccinate lyase